MLDLLKQAVWLTPKLYFRGHVEFSSLTTDRGTIKQKENKAYAPRKHEPYIKPFQKIIYLLIRLSSKPNLS